MLVIKNFGTFKVNTKARYIAQCHKDREKGFMNSVPSMEQRTTRLIISFAVINYFRLFGTDISQIYLQSA